MSTALMNAIFIVIVPAMIVWQLYDGTSKHGTSIKQPIMIDHPIIHRPILIHPSMAPHIVLEKTSKKVIFNDRDLFCLTKNIYHEAGFEPVLGKYAVAQITLNRLQSSKLPSKSICSVVLDPYQFSWANNHKIRWTKPVGRAWDAARKVAEDVVIHGTRVSGLESAMFYHADYVSPRWKDESAKIAHIGRHVFYSKAL